eukprot:CAMPEP_0184046448 /NCGR_PEP_ID=MMETSP0956-20121227/1570_1 /TAXON_ID=627963 /ORGANISM="Aplanochytrium sp, Strain PBS07" /LENGTH=266 /DNA_ID=CAMNT_0026338049 /DNA_START=366 /DNA_END=1166 /DNA_ORIENTATION=+
MAKKLRDSENNSVVYLNIGPFTDLACLVLNFPEEVKRLKGVVALAGQDSYEPMPIESWDFNVAMDPLAAAVVIESDLLEEKIKFLAIPLTGQTSEDGNPRRIYVKNVTAPNNQTEKENRLSIDFLNTALYYHNYGYEGQNGWQEGPFDQYTVFAAQFPDSFSCDRRQVYVQQCTYSNSEYVDNAENEDDNLQRGYCPPGNGEAVPSILTYSNTTDESSQLMSVMGSGNLNGFGLSATKARYFTVCTDFKDDKEFERFKNYIAQYSY